MVKSYKYVPFSRGDFKTVDWIQLSRQIDPQVHSILTGRRCHTEIFEIWAYSNRIYTIEDVRRVPDIFLICQKNCPLVKIIDYKHQRTYFFAHLFRASFLHIQSKSVSKHEKQNVLLACIDSSAEVLVRDSVLQDHVYNINATKLLPKKL